MIPDNLTKNHKRELQYLFDAIDKMRIHLWDSNSEQTIKEDVINWSDSLRMKFRIESTECDHG